MEVAGRGSARHGKVTGTPNLARLARGKVADLRLNSRKKCDVRRGRAYLPPPSRRMAGEGKLPASLQDAEPGRRIRGSRRDLLDPRLLSSNPSGLQPARNAL